MKRFGTNVGRVDALSRRVIGALALLGGLVALGPFYRALSLLTWAVLALLFCTGLFFFAPGLPGGTAFFGLLLMIVSVLDGWLAATYHGGVALIIGICVALLGFGTAALKWAPLNALAHLDTRQADQGWGWWS